MALTVVFFIVDPRGDPKRQILRTPGGNSLVNSHGLHWACSSTRVSTHRLGYGTCGPDEIRNGLRFAMGLCFSHGEGSWDANKPVAI